MRSFLQRLSSRKFLTALAVQVASVAAIFWPQQQESVESALLRIAALVAMLLAALGYGQIEAGVDSRLGTSAQPQDDTAPSPAQEIPARGNDAQ